MRKSSTALLADLFNECEDHLEYTQYSQDSTTHYLCNEKHITSSIGLLFLAGILKLLLTIFTFGSKIPAGLYIPALSAGACLGRAFGSIIEQRFNEVGDTGYFSTCSNSSECISPSIYAFLGAAAVLSGITRMGVSLTVTLLELTGGLEYIFPVMVTVMCSKFMGNAFGSLGMIATIIKENGYPYLHHEKELNVEQAGDATSIMTKNPTCLTLYNETFGDCQKILDQYPYHGYPIINNKEDGLMIGYISQSDLLNLYNKAINSAATT